MPTHSPSRHGVEDVAAVGDGEREEVDDEDREVESGQDSKIKAYSIGRYERPMKTAHAISVASGPASATRPRFQSSRLGEEGPMSTFGPVSFIANPA